MGEERRERRRRSAFFRTESNRRPFARNTQTNTMAKLKVSELKSKSKQELENQLRDLKNELALLRVAKVTGGAPNKLSKIKLVRLGIAQILTVISQNERKALKMAYSDKVIYVYIYIYINCYVPFLP